MMYFRREAPFWEAPVSNVFVVDTPDFLLETYINWLLVIDGELFFLVYFVFAVTGLISKIETWHQSSYLTLRQKLPSGEL